MIKKNRHILVKSVYGNKPDFEEKIFSERDGYYRKWDPTRSKLAAAIMKGVKGIEIKKGMNILYLGASHGYTCSYISDLVGKSGLIFAIDFAPRVIRDLWLLSEKRSNIIPIIADANQPVHYFHRVLACDLLIQDVAQRNQIEMFLKNMVFVKPKGMAYLALKSRSVDITKKPQAVFNEAESTLQQKKELIDRKKLEPYEKDHCFYVVKP